MKSNAFEVAYKLLNKEQKKAVDTIEGPVMVIAGPGTGKTTILTLRIANILRLTDIPPDAILALTFTESGVYAMRKKLAELIGSSAYRVQITTFHGFANNIIQNNPGSFPRIIGARPATEIDQVRILESLIKRGKWKQVKPMGDVFYYVRPVLSAIRDLKKENYTPEKYKRWLLSDETAKEAEEAKRERNLELTKLYSLYEKELRENKLYDYEDMLIEAVRVLEDDNELLLTIRENCQYILADEHQDSNGVQNKMLELLAGIGESRPNLFIVGDEKQAIYRFQGASLENFLYFKNRFPEAVSVVLTESYRSHQNLLDASHTVAQSLPKSESVDRPRLLNTAHVAKDGATGSKVESISFPDEETEASFVAKKIKESGETARIAVLYRNNRHSAPIAEALEKEGVEFVVRSDEDIFADADIQNLITLFRAINNPTDDENMAKTMLVDFSGLDAVDCFRAFNVKRNKKTPLISLLFDNKRLTEVGVENPSALVRFASNLKSLATKGRSVPLTEFIDEVASGSGFRDKLIASDRGLAKLEKLHSFYEVAKSLSLTNPACRLPDLMSHIDSAGRFGVRLGAGRALELPYGTELMTAHRAKGLEFDTVFITRTTDDHWGGKTGRKLFELPLEARNAAQSGQEEDERRLFYVSMTRAKSRIYITHSLSRSDGKLLAPSRFIEDIDKKYINESRESADPKALMHPSVAREHLNLRKLTEPTVKYLQKLFLEQGMTVTALNNYLECPWQYFFRNLVRLPSAPERHQDFGSAIHDALRIFQNEVKSGKKSKESRLLALFSLNLRKFGFPDDEMVVWEKRGKKALSVFFYSHDWLQIAKSELEISGIEFLSESGKKIDLRGKIDTVVFDGDRARVTDFKTGKPKSRNEILGKTKNSSGGMFRQLVFYKLLLENMKKGLEVVTGTIEFVEPDKSGKCRREDFPLTSEDRKVLEEELAGAVTEIYNLSFWGKSCGKRDCEYCALAERIRK